jgi:hypothetical protein
MLIVYDCSGEGHGSLSFPEAADAMVDYLINLKVSSTLYKSHSKISKQIWNLN